MENKGRSEQGIFGTVHHYDERGKRVGRSDPGLFGVPDNIVQCLNISGVEDAPYNDREG